MAKGLMFLTCIVVGFGVVSCSGDEDGDSSTGVTSVLAGQGLTGGGQASSVTLEVDMTAVQARVEGSCTGATAIQSIDEQGAAACSTAYNGHNNDPCTSDNGYRIIGNMQQEFGCHLTCGEICANHGLVCEFAYRVDGAYRNCTVINNDEALYCWCKDQ